MGVNFPRGRFIAQVYRCSPRHLLAIGLFIEITMPAGASGGKEGGMQWGESLVYSIVKQKHLQQKQKKQKNLTAQLVPRGFLGVR